MSYDQIAHIVKMGGTVLFFAVFVIVIAYALWPSNRGRFERAARSPLEDRDYPLTEDNHGH